MRISPRHQKTWRLRIICAISSLASCFAGEVELLNFSRDIRPILSAKCFACHGPDSQDRDAEYRIDTQDGAFADLGGYFAIVPGKPNKSELINRITTDDEDEIMPPPKHKNPLTQEEIVLLTRWIAEGAPYTGHWAFSAVKRPKLPAVKVDVINPIDNFIATRLKKKGLAFSPEASPETLVRRLHLDLTGLPPTPEEVDTFVKDPQAAYLSTVDRLINSIALAERLALEWLDVARFADTNGYSIDDHRDMWVWRDWVIDSFQKKMPYDQFIREQIAGDLMENATEKQKIATGFLRNSMNTHEGGTIAEEYRVSAIADKIDTVATAFLGLTVKCAQCHDHKYDPISQKDYYRFFAFFNTSTEPGKGASLGNTMPFLDVDPILQDKETFKAACKDRIDALQHANSYPEPFLGNARKKWERVALANPSSNPVFPFPETKEAVKNLSWIWSNPAGQGSSAWFRKTFSLEKIPESAKLFVSCDNEADILINGKKIGKNPDWRTPSVFDIKPMLRKGKNLIAVAAKNWEKEKGSASLLALVALPNGRYIGTDSSWLVTKNLKPKWNRLGEVEGFSTASVVAPHGASPWGDTFALYARSQKKNKTDFIAALKKPDHQRSAAEQKLIIDSFVKASHDMKVLQANIQGEIAQLNKSITSGKTNIMVMDEGNPDRKTPILIRGAYDQHGEIVSPGIPTLFGDLPENTKPDRLALANWLTDPAQPLTARVTVNRYWQMIFGTGLVKTAEDFGSQGEWPSHPELLDWLAAEFVASGWDVRALIKLMITSQTYRQSSAVSKPRLTQDPYNRLLARAPRFRLSAEAVRDTALTIGGLLDDKAGGPSVYPPQPHGLWKEISHFGHPSMMTAQHFYPDRNAQVYRRSMYTFWKRTSPPPMMMAFDASTRETCSVRRSLTNTPLQALVLMNSPQYVESAQGLARRMQKHNSGIDARIIHGFRLATARQPSTDELKILKSAYQSQLDYFNSAPERGAQFLAYGRGFGKVVHGTELAALTTVASLILNLDETITRE